MRASSGLISLVKIYLWQILSLITGFGTLFVVTPFLASNAIVFGIYSVVSAFTVFLSYADIGFLSAGMKFVSEAVVNDNRSEEIKIVGFVTTVLLAFVIIASLGTLILSYNPEILIKGIKDEGTFKIASRLLIIFSVSAPLVVFQRSLQLIFNSRLKDYLFQRVLTFCNILKICSVYYFFSNGDYNIVGYFAFSQICLFIAIAAGFLIIRQTFAYDIKAYLQAIRFSKSVFDKTKKLAFGSLVLTVGWIIFYEMDLFVIGRVIGAKEAAIFSLSLTVMTFLRSLYGILYNPFTAKLNHLVGKGEHAKFNYTLKLILTIGLPLTALPPVIMFLTMHSFILSWVGHQYVEVVSLIKIMILSYIFVFVSNPAGIGLMAQLKIKQLYLMSIIMPGTFWFLVSIGYPYFGMEIFAWAKLFVFFIIAVYSIALIQKFFEFNFLSFLRENILPFLIVVALLKCFVEFGSDFLPTQKGKAELFRYLGFIFVLYIVGLVLSYLFVRPFRIVVNTVINNLLMQTDEKKNIDLQ